MPHIQTDRFTVIGTEPHLQAGDSATRPVSILHCSFDTPGGVAELRLTADEARDLVHALSKAIAATEAPEASDPLELLARLYGFAHQYAHPSALQAGSGLLVAVQVAIDRGKQAQAAPRSDLLAAPRWRIS